MSNKDKREELPTITKKERILISAVTITFILICVSASVIAGVNV